MTAPTSPRYELVVIPCGGAKLDHAAPAAELYTGGYFRACLAYGRAYGERVLILSALHGLIELDRVVEPYELRMGEPGAVDHERATLYGQALGLGVAELVDVALIGGRRYVNAARSVWPGAVAPLDALPSGHRGIGYQLQALNAWTAARSGVTA